MLYMVELKYEQEQRDAALQYFWDRGFTRHGGDVTVQGVWVATDERIGYALVNAADSEHMDRACEPLREFGSVVYRHVAGIDEI